MKYGQIAGNRSIDAKIKRCFELISEEDASKFERRFANLPKVDDTNDERLHAFRELIIGAYLVTQGFRVQHSRPIEGKTPDWSILGDEDVLDALVEVVTFHRGVGKTTDRLYATIQGKFSTYKDLADRHEIPYVVGIHVDFEHTVDDDEIDDCLFNDQYGLFALYPEVRGAIFCVVDVASYPIRYYRNPDAKRPLTIRDGIF
ncbi:MAG: hypothetical protein ABSH35_22795 [Isosphaeraceae bacterium]|jgi:hypothetical protein